MEFTPHELIEIILQIRNPETVNDASNQMLQFLNNPQSIEMLFEILSMKDIDDYIYQFAIISVHQFCELNKEKINEELIDYIRSNLMNVLRNFRDSIPFSILLQAISTAIKFPSDWTEIQEYAFDVDNSKIIYHIKLLSMLIPFFSVEMIYERIDFFSQLLSTIFQPDESNPPPSKDDYEIQCSSVALSGELVKRTQNTDLADQLRPLITKILETIITETDFDTDLLNQILNPISDVKIFQLRLIDTQYAIQLATSFMMNRKVPEEYRIQLNDLIEICVRDLELQIIPDLIRNILAIEFNLTILLYQNEQDDEKFTWSYQIEDIVEYVYKRSTSQFIVNNVRNNFKTYCENENEGIRFFQLLLLKTLSKYSDIPNSQDLLIEIYPYLFNFLSDPSPRFRKYTAIILGFISTAIKDYVIDNMLDNLEKANAFVDEYHTEEGTFLLTSLIECANNTDDFIEIEYGFVKELLYCSNPFVCLDAIDIIKNLITNSRSKLVLISKDAYSTFVTAITNDPSKYSGLLLPLSYLISKDDDLSDYISDFISSINNGLNSEDNEIIQNSFSAVQNFIKLLSEKDKEQTLNILSEILPSIKKITLLPGEDNIVCQMKGSSLITIVDMLFASEMNEEILTFYFECFDSFLSVTNDTLTIYMTKSCLHFLYLIERKPLNYQIVLDNENVQKDMGELIIKIISSNELIDETFDAIFIQFISKAINIFGFERLKIESNVIAQYISSKLDITNYYQSLPRSDKSFKKMIKSICEAFLAILVSDTDKKSESHIIEFFSKYLVELLNDNLNPKNQTIAIHTFSLILNDEKSRSIFTEQSYQELIQQITSFIAESNPIVAKHSSKFFYTILPSNLESLRPFADEIIKNLFQRFNSTSNQNNQSISLRETIIFTLCIFYEKYNGMIPTQQMLTALFSCLPLINKLKYSNQIYFFLSSIQNEIIKDEELTRQLFNIYVLVISDKNKESSYIDQPVLFCMAYFINQHSDLFQSEEEENEVIAQIFKDDEVAYQTFIRLYESYLEQYMQMTNPEIDLENVQVIDLTGQQFE